METLWVYNEKPYCIDISCAKQLNFLVVDVKINPNENKKVKKDEGPYG